MYLRMDGEKRDLLENEAFYRGIFDECFLHGSPRPYRGPLGFTVEGLGGSGTFWNMHSSVYFKER